MRLIVNLPPKTTPFDGRQIAFRFGYDCGMLPRRAAKRKSWMPAFAGMTGAWRLFFFFAVAEEEFYQDAGDGGDD